MTARPVSPVLAAGQGAGHALLSHEEGKSPRGATGHKAQCVSQTQQQAQLGPWTHEHYAFK